MIPNGTSRTVGQLTMRALDWQVRKAQKDNLFTHQRVTLTAGQDIIFNGAFHV